MSKKNKKETRLTPRKQRFADQWLRHADATRAHEEAGFRSKSRAGHGKAGGALLRDASVRDYITSRQERLRLEIDQDIAHVREQLQKMLFCDVEECFDDDGCFRPINEWPEPLRKSVSSIEIKELIETRDVENEETGKTVRRKQMVGYLKKVRFWSKTEATKQLLQHMGGFAPTKVEHGGNIVDLILETQKDKTK